MVFFYVITLLFILLLAEFGRRMPGPQASVFIVWFSYSFSISL